MPRKVLPNTDHAPTPIGPYNQCVVASGLVYTAGQIPLDPATGKLVRGDLTAQTQQTLKNIEAILQHAGSSIDQCIKLTVYMTNLSHAPIINQVFQSHFSEGNEPARSLVEVQACPAGAAIEIDCIASL